MAFRQTTFAINEWYHCYTRTIEKRAAFETREDCERFQQTLFLCNTERPLRRDDLPAMTHADVFALSRGEPLVAVGSYCLMPTHFHLLLHEIREGGISRFMQKVGTAFTMYFNIRRQRVGGLFIKPFRAKHIDDDAYLQRAVQYIHLNPAEMFESQWKHGNVNDMEKLEASLRAYRFSSWVDYEKTSRPEGAILDQKLLTSFGSMKPLRETLDEAHAYYQELLP